MSSSVSLTSLIRHRISVVRGYNNILTRKIFELKKVGVSNGRSKRIF